MPTGQAATILGLHRKQVDKLIAAGMLDVRQRTAGGQRRVDPTQVLTLAARPFVTKLRPGDLAVHLGPLDVETNRSNLRTHFGWHRDAGSRGLTGQQIEAAWAGLWSCDPDRYDGALVGVVSGFVVELAAIGGYKRINGHRVSFTLIAPTAKMVAAYAGRRIHARPGSMIQPLG